MAVWKSTHKFKVSEKKQSERDLRRHEENQKLALGAANFFMVAAQRARVKGFKR